MKNQDFTTTILVDKSPEEAFKAITNVRGWWSEEIEGGTSKLHDEFSYHYQDIHRCTMKLIEVVPSKKVVWLVLDNHFNFIKDRNEWKGNKIIFEISPQDKKTLIRFTQEGLVPAYECYGVCRDAWTNYIGNSLRSLITTGKGQPNSKEGSSLKTDQSDFQISITVHASAHEAFQCINNVTKWWTENLEGNSQKLNDEFAVRFGDIHYSKQKLTEFVPDKKVVWLITDSKLNFIKDKKEWNNTRIAFELVDLDNKFTKINFTHIGLVPELECHDACSNAWSQYISESLLSLINTGKGHPEPKEKMSAIKN